MEKKDIKKFVRDRYASVVTESTSCCGTIESSGRCCGTAEEIGRSIGYSDGELKSVPVGANLGLGCGNPTAMASIRTGETVLDLGSGAGFDCFLAAEKTGPEGWVIGVDMTPEMIDRARENARDGKVDNVEFRLGEIEHIPAADSSVDLVISNCVINLSPEKDAVFREAFRVLKTGGRIMVSDIALLAELPAYIRESAESWAGCISGAMLKDDYLEAVGKAGFSNVEILGESAVPFDLVMNDPAAREMMEKFNISDGEARRISSLIVSVKVAAGKV